MEYEEHLSAVRRESADIISGLRAGPLDVKVPTCPDWTLVDLATHLGQFCGLWTHVLCESTGAPKTPFTDPAADQSDAEWFASWFEEQAAYLTEKLASLEAATPSWTWHPTDQTTGFIARRAANELAVHRYDVQSARSAPQPVDGPLAVDGIEEIFVMVAAWRVLGNGGDTGEGQTLHLHASDPDAEWTLTLAPDGLVVERAHSKADLALRGSASDLELILYDRPTLGTVERFGDEAVLDAWTRAFRFG